eukprot:TRINITY_DN8806_c0_g1_i2.p1 TRINITY_DN8806_c0_g1~~TRINITY_DN8806_c0_g1_i2.p1  ORF type:complete len:232 (+),score=7.29 TRINITY_DN8806_c0_g1_i2:76-771(+)
MRPHIRLHDWSHLSRQAARSLAKADIPDLDFSLRELMREAKKSGNSMLGCQNHFRRLIGRRCRREPLQYITRYWPFRDCTLRVRSPVLIPRPETEDLVELARLDIETLSSPSMDQCNVMLDVGTGSGAIVVSFLSEVQGWTAVALDVSAKAINLARLNAIRYVRQFAKSCQCIDRVTGIMWIIVLLSSMHPWTSFPHSILLSVCALQICLTFRARMSIRLMTSFYTKIVER